MREAGGLSASHQWSAVFAAMISAVSIGFGRFAFTGVYPVMVGDGVLTISQGTFAASANYAGYLLGALLAARAKPVDSHKLCLWTTAANVLCLALLALVREPWLVILIRGLAGVFSALSLVGVSLWLLQHRGNVRGAPLLFSGVGIGIVLSAEMLAVGKMVGLHSPGLWVVLAVGALVIGGIGVWGMDGRPAEAPAQAARRVPPVSAQLAAGKLAVVYGLGGFGYIITATYLPLLIKGSLGSVDPIQIWAAFGLGAVPSCFFWHAIHVRLGSRPALMLNMIVQAIGVVLPALSQTAIGYLASALLVGGTFMGTVTICMAAARNVAHTVRMNFLAIMTAAYGLGQIIGPLVAGSLYARSHSFSPSLFAAGGALAIGALLCAGSSRRGAA